MRPINTFQSKLDDALYINLFFFLVNIIEEITNDNKSFIKLQKEIDKFFGTPNKSDSTLNVLQIKAEDWIRTDNLLSLQEKSSNHQDDDSDQSEITIQMVRELQFLFADEIRKHALSQIKLNQTITWPKLLAALERHWGGFRNELRTQGQDDANIAADRKAHWAAAFEQHKKSTDVLFALFSSMLQTEQDEKQDTNINIMSEYREKFSNDQSINFANLLHTLMEEVTSKDRPSDFQTDVAKFSRDISGLQPNDKNSMAKLQERFTSLQKRSKEMIKNMPAFPLNDQDLVTHIENMNPNKDSLHETLVLFFMQKIYHAQRNMMPFTTWDEFVNNFRTCWNRRFNKSVLLSCRSSYIDRITTTYPNEEVANIIEDWNNSIQEFENYINKLMPLDFSAKVAQATPSRPVAAGQIGSMASSLDEKSKKRLTPHSSDYSPQKTQTGTDDNTQTNMSSVVGEAGLTMHITPVPPKSSISQQGGPGLGSEGNDSINLASTVADGSEGETDLDNNSIMISQPPSFPSTPSLKDSTLTTHVSPTTSSGVDNSKQNDGVSATQLRSSKAATLSDEQRLQVFTVLYAAMNAGISWLSLSYWVSYWKRKSVLQQVAGIKGYIVKHKKGEDSTIGQLWRLAGTCKPSGHHRGDLATDAVLSTLYLLAFKKCIRGSKSRVGCEQGGCTLFSSKATSNLTNMVKADSRILYRQYASDKKRRMGKIIARLVEEPATISVR